MTARQALVATWAGRLADAVRRGDAQAIARCQVALAALQDGGPRH